MCPIRLAESATTPTLTRMTKTASFHYERSDKGVVTITLNRPERLNALTFEVYRELTDTFAALRAESDVRVVVITGSGRAFARR